MNKFALRRDRPLRSIAYIRRFKRISACSDVFGTPKEVFGVNAGNLYKSCNQTDYQFSIVCFFGIAALVTADEITGEYENV